MYVFFLILIWFSLIFSLNEWFFLWFLWLIEWMNDLNCFWGCENEWKYVFFEVVSKCLKIGENRVFWDPRDLMNFIEFSIDCDFYGFLWIFLNDWMIFFFWMNDWMNFLFCFLIEEFFFEWMNVSIESVVFCFEWVWDDEMMMYWIEWKDCIYI